MNRVVPFISGHHPAQNGACSGAAIRQHAWTRHHARTLEGFADGMAKCPEDDGRARPVAMADGVTVADLAGREANHRIKNNLHLLASMLTFRARRTTAPTARQALHEAVACIHAIASVHESLAHGGTTGDVAIGAMLRELCTLTGRLCPDIQVVCETEAVPAVLDAARAVPLILMINEMLINAVRHAYDRPAQTAAAQEVRVRLVADAAALSITVTDSGKGMAMPGTACPSGTGSTIVQGLATQIGATIQRCSMPGGGTVVVVRVPHSDIAPPMRGDDRHDGACHSAPAEPPAGDR